jgi:hypothetical protein
MRFVHVGPPFLAIVAHGRAHATPRDLIDNLPPSKMRWKLETIWTP